MTVEDGKSSERSVDAYKNTYNSWKTGDVVGLIVGEMKGKSDLKDEEFDSIQKVMRHGREFASKFRTENATGSANKFDAVLL